MILIASRHNSKGLKADINFGRIKKTDGQRKKHISQMTLEEQDFLVSKIRNVDNIIYSNHLLRKQIVFDKDTLIRTLNSSNLKDFIIEYNETTSKDFVDRRVLIRSDIIDTVLINNNTYKSCNLCFVLSIITGTIITIYYNTSNDSHTSLNWDRYDKNLKIIY